MERTLGYVIYYYVAAEFEIFSIKRLIFAKRVSVTRYDEEPTNSTDMIKISPIRLFCTY